MTSEISELSVANGNNQILKYLIVEIGYRKLTNLTCHRPNIAMNLYSIIQVYVVLYLWEQSVYCKMVAYKSAPLSAKEKGSHWQQKEQEIPDSAEENASGKECLVSVVSWEST